MPPQLVGWNEPYLSEPCWAGQPTCLRGLGKGWYTSMALIASPHCCRARCCSIRFCYKIKVNSMANIFIIHESDSPCAVDHPGINHNADSTRKAGQVV